MALEIFQHILKNRVSPSTVTEKWTQECAHLNSKVSIVDLQNSTSGIFLGIGEFGQALLKIDDMVKEFYSGSLIL